MRFEKVSFNSFWKDMCKIDPTFTLGICEKAYEDIRLPRRASVSSAGYDFVTPIRFYIAKKSTILIPTGIKCYFSETESKNWHLKLYPRSSLAIRHKIVLSNCTGVIDADYYNNPENEGDIMLSLFNYGERGLQINAGDKIMQGIFEAYALTEDDIANDIRRGGIGSSGR